MRWVIDKMGEKNVNIYMVLWVCAGPSPRLRALLLHLNIKQHMYRRRTRLQIGYGFSRLVSTKLAL